MISKKQNPKEIFQKVAAIIYGLSRSKIKQHLGDWVSKKPHSLVVAKDNLINYFELCLQFSDVGA
jgi:hypothetical protein